MNMKKQAILKRLQEHYDLLTSYGYEVLAIFLQGSQNYNLDLEQEDYQSDIDSKAIVLPTLDDLITGAPKVSRVYTDKYGAHVEVKDIRVMIEMWKKQNISYLELLFTDYYITNPKYGVYALGFMAMRDRVVHMNFPQLFRCISGMSKEKCHTLEHIYPSTEEKIAKYGYDGKQLCHIIRLNDLSKKLIRGVPYKDALWYEGGEVREAMIKAKLHEYSLEEARNIAKIMDEETLQIKNEVAAHFGDNAFDARTYGDLESLTYELIKNYIIDEIRKSAN